MTSFLFWAVSGLAAAKVGVIRVRKPFEWVGELASGVIALGVGLVVALAYSLYAVQAGLPVDGEPGHIRPMISPRAWSEYYQLLMPLL